MNRFNCSLMILACLILPVAILASTEGREPSEDAVLKEGDSIVYGMFTGKNSVSVATYDDMFDDSGKRIDYEEVVTCFEFNVLETLDGTPTPARIDVKVVGGEFLGVSTPMAFKPAEVGVPVILSLLPDEDGFVAVHGRQILSVGPLKVDQARSRIQQLRAR